MLEVVLSNKEDFCSAEEKERGDYFTGEKEEEALKDRENTWEKGRVHVRGKT